MLYVSFASFWLAFATLVGAAVVFGYEWLVRRKPTVAPEIIAAAGGVFLTIAVVSNMIESSGRILTGSNQIIFVALATVALFFVAQYVFKVQNSGVFLITISSMLLGVAQLTSGARTDIAAHPQAGEFMDSALIGFHVGLIVLANMFFLVAGVAAALYLVQSRALKRHSNSTFTRRLPSLANLEKLSSRMAVIGLPFYMAGQFMGIHRAVVVDAAGWFADPRIILSSIISIVFVAYVILFARNKTSGQITATIAVVGAVLVVALMILARVLPVGFHIFGVVG